MPGKVLPTCYTKMIIQSPVIGDLKVGDDDSQIACIVNKCQDTLLHISRTEQVDTKTSTETKESMHARGRKVLAKKNITPGTKVLHEKPIGFAVLTDFVDSCCRNCLNIVTEDTSITCDECEEACWCSTKCRSDSIQMHKNECKVWKHSETIEMKGNVDKNLIKITASVLSRMCIDPEAKPISRKGGDLTFKLYAGIVSDLESHIPSPNAFEIAATEILRLLPDTISFLKNVSIESIMHILGSINPNVHDLRYQATSVGLGLFPVASMLNHSCSPNCTFSNEGGDLSCFTIEPIKKGEELVVNYVDLYNTTRQRQEQLLNEKQFSCHCDRCMLTPRSDSQLAIFKHDQFMEGILCTSKGKKKCKGMYITESSDRNSSWKCFSCGHNITSEDISNIEEKCYDEIKNALIVYNNPGSEVNTSLSSLLKALELCKLRVSDQHALYMDILPPLINCYGAIGDYQSKLKYCKQLVQLSSSGFPLYSPALIPIKESMIVTYAQLINSMLQEAVSQPHKRKIFEKLLKTYQYERTELLKHICKLYSINYGDKHPMTIQAIEVMDK